MGWGVMGGRGTEGKNFERVVGLWVLREGRKGRDLNSDRGLSSEVEEEEEEEGLGARTRPSRV